MFAGCERGTEGSTVISQETVEGTVFRWFECEECQDGELNAVVDLGERAIEYLAEIYLNAPSRELVIPEFEAVVRRNFQKSYRDLQAAIVANPDFAGDPMTEDEYVQLYVDNLNVRYRARAEIALREIGGPEADAVLAASGSLTVEP